MRVDAISIFRSSQFINAVIAILVSVISGSVQAQVDLARSEKLYLSLGYYNVFRADSTLSYVKRGLGAGLALKPTETLGLDLESSVVKLDGHYRLFNQSQISISWYRLDSDATKVIEAEFEWVNQDGEQILIEGGSRITSSLLYDIFKISYDWSFYHTEKVELTVGGGFHISRFEVDMEVNADANGNPVTENARNAAHTVPLPTLGLGLSYRVSQKWFWFLKAEGFYLEYDDWDGLYSETELGIEYSVTHNLGLGIGLSSDNLSVTETTEEHQFSYNNRLSGISLYLSWSVY